MKKVTGMLAVLALTGLSSSMVMAGDWKNYRVTITNATSHHVITPPLIVIHNKKFKLFSVADAASEGLATQAETGDPSALYNEVSDAKGVYDVIVGSNVIVYGTKSSYEFRAPKGAKISMTGMLASTNDAFTAISSKALPKRSVSYMATTYDAGSEENNEDCRFIPGPPCSAESGNQRATEGAEGFITVHAGIKGRSDLSAAHLDWRGATSIVTIKRLHD
ncbi:MAG: spondin domain-containing protein [Woeseiaceae bacterium]